MEFIEYYRIIRRRGWIVLLLAALAAAAMVAVRLMPREVRYPAATRVLVREVAQRVARFQDGNLVVGLRERGGTFWRDIAQIVGSDPMLQQTGAEMGMSAAEVRQRFRVVGARQVEDANVLEVVVEGDTREGAVLFCDTLIGELEKVWQMRQVAAAQAAAEGVRDRTGEAVAVVEELELEQSVAARAHGGTPPPFLMQQLSAELGSVNQQISSAELSLGGAEARREVVERTPASRVEAGRGEAVAPSTRVAALEEQILRKQVELDLTRSIRQAEHPDVQALEAQIAALRRRLAEVEREEQQAPPGETARPIALEQMALEARVNAEALERQLGLLRSRAAEINARLPALRDAAISYEEREGRLTAAKTRLEAMRAQAETLAREDALREGERMFEVLRAAEAQRVPRRLASFLMRLGVGIAAGVGLGILVIFLLHYVDLSFSNEEEAERMLGVRVLAGLPRTDLQAVEPPAQPPPEAGRAAE